MSGEFDYSNLLTIVPKSFHFDGYNIFNSPNNSSKPFFSNNTYYLGNYILQIKMGYNHFSGDYIELKFESPCKFYKHDFVNCRVDFSSYTLSIDDFARKLSNAVKNNSDFITFDIPVRYCSLPNCVCPDICDRKSNSAEPCFRLIKDHPKNLTAAVSFNPDDIRKTLGFPPRIKTTGGNTTMKKNNNFLGMNFELGVSKDSNIASTLMGVAVRNPANGNWYTFDAARNTRKNIANMKMGNFPIFLLPTKKLEVGDLIKLDGKYDYVKAVNGDTITLLGATDGVIREVLPEETLIGNMKFYTKVVAMDPKSLMDPNSKKGLGSNVLAAICMMQWNNNETAEFSLDNINNDSFNGLGSCWPMLMAMNGSELGDMFGNADLPTLLLLGNGSTDMMQNLILAQLLNGNNESPLKDVLSIEVLPEKQDHAVICEECNATYPDGTNFCPKCGKSTKKLAASCPKCGTALMKGAMFCHKCGANVTQQTCPKCGKTVEDGENFCSKCGTNLKATPDAKKPVKTTRAKRTPKKNELLIINPMPDPDDVDPSDKES